MASRSLDDYYSDYFGGDTQTGGENSQPANTLGPTDPPVRAKYPDDGNYGLIPSSDINPETGFKWNSPEDLAALNKKYGGAQGGQSAQSWLQQYQTGNQATEGLDRTLQGLKAAGYDASPYMYGSTPSGNELTIDGQKRKIISGEGDNAQWYQWGSNDSGGNNNNNGGGGSYVAGGGTGFASPAYNQLNDLANQRINQLNQPTSFPQLDAYFAQLAEEKALARQRAQAFADQLTSRIGELQQPLMSQADSARVRSSYQNQTQAERDRALEANRERLSLRGFDPRTSGLLEGSNRATNTSYDARTGNIDATLANQEIMANENRKNQATRLQQLAYQALQGGDLGALQSAASAMEAERNQFDLAQAREREKLSTAGIPVELENTGLSNALSTLGAGGGNGSALQSLFGALGLGQQQQQIDSSNTAALFGGLGNWLNTILNAASRF